MAFFLASLLTFVVSMASSTFLSGAVHYGGVFRLRIGQPAWLAEDLWSIGNASAFAAKEARLVDKCEQFIRTFPNITFGPIAEGFRHAGTEQGDARLRKQGGDGMI
jgi:hypothetical protein